MEFKKKKEMVRAALLKNDVSEIAKRLGVTTSTVRHAMRLDTLVGASDTEQNVWVECINLIEERKRKAAKIEAKVIATAETL